MKKNIIILSTLAVAATAFFSCAKTETDTNAPKKVKGVPFEIVANPHTKTTNDGLSTDWKADDAINLFHAEASTTDYSENDKFTIASEDLATGTFRGTLASALDPSKSYDWYALYPYNVGLTTPANTTYNISFSANNRTQQGYNSTAHLTTLPLLGVATDVAAATTPTLSMKNLASVVEVVVTNNSGEGLTITGVSITAPQKIVGDFIVDFSDPDNLSFTDGTYCYPTASLKVNSGTEIANGETARFYIPVKPFSLAIGDDLTIKVNTFSKTVTMTSAFSFASGKVTTVNFNYNKSFTSQNFYVASSIMAGDKVIFTNGNANGDIKAMGHYSSGNNIPAVAGTIEGGRLASTSAMGIFTVAGNSTDGFSFFDPENELYLTATSATSNNLKGIDADDGFTTWSVVITDGVAEVLNKGTGKTTYHIRYNSSSTLFSAYTSAQTPIYIFKLDSRTPLTTYEFATASITKSPEEATSYTGQVVTASPSVSSTYSISGDAIGSINSATGALTLNGSEGTAVITANFAGDATYAPAMASYTVIVKGKSITLSSTTTNMPASYGTANTFTEYTLEGYKFKIQQVYKNGSKLQMRAAGNASGTGTIYNTSTFPGKIKTITITYDSSDANKNCSIIVGNTENPTSGTSITPSSSGNAYTFDCSSSNADYFVLTNGSGAGYLSSIKIEWK